MIRIASFGVPFLTALVLTSISLPESSQADEPSRLLLLAPDNEDSGDRQAVELALKAHLKSYPFEVIIISIPKVPGKVSAQYKLAHREMIENDGKTALWIDSTRREATVVQLDSEGNVNKVRRRFGCIAHAIPECGDTIASMVSSAVSSWMIPSEDSQEYSAPGEPAFDNELAPTKLNNLPWTMPEPVVRLQAGAGYGVLAFDGTVNTSHGLVIGVSALVVRYLIWEAGVDFFWRLHGHSAENGGSISVSRVDLATRLGGVVPLNRWSVSLSAGIVADFTDARDHSENLVVNSDHSRRLGFSARLVARFNITRFLGLAVGGGLDAFDSAARYSGTMSSSGTEEPLLRLGDVQGAFFAAIEFGVGLGQMPDR